MELLCQKSNPGQRCFFRNDMSIHVLGGYLNDSIRFLTINNLRSSD